MSESLTWSQHMSDTGRMEHDPNQRGGECVAQGYSSERAVVQAWMNSPGHRAILLGNYTQIGYGRVGDWWTLRVT